MNFSQVCDDGDPCTYDACDPQTGECTFTPNTEAGCPCDDNNPCTINDTYNQNGVCQGKPLDCNDGNPCTDDVCNPQTGICEYINNTQPCDDGNACTQNDHCSGGTCIGTFIDCDDGNPCTKDTCDPILGCLNTPLADNTPCDSGDDCLENGVCINGVCSEDPIVCDDGDPCTNDLCVPGIGCQFIPVDASSHTVTTKIDGAVGSLRNTIADACHGDTILFSSDLNSSISALTLGRITIDKDLVIQGNGQTNTKISGSNQQQIFYIASGKIVHILNLRLFDAITISNGGAFENDGTVYLKDILMDNNFEGGTNKAFTNHATIYIEEGTVEILE